MRPRDVQMDSWYSGVENLKAIRALGWHFLTRLKSNRLVNPDGKGNVPISEVEIGEEGRVVHLKRLEAYRLRSELSWYEAKGRIVREAIRAHLRCPLYIIQPTA